MAKKPAASAPALTAELLALIAEREQILPWLEQAKARELEIRAQLAAALFPSPVEGVNKLETADGYSVSLDHKINRSLDEAALDAVMQELPEDSPYRNVGVLIGYKPVLVLSGYRAAPPDVLKIVQQAISEKPGTPTLTITKAPDIAVGGGDSDCGATSAAQARANLGTPIMDAYEEAKQASKASRVHTSPAAFAAAVETSGKEKLRAAKANLKLHNEAVREEKRAKKSKK